MRIVANELFVSLAYNIVRAIRILCFVYCITVADFEFDKSQSTNMLLSIKSYAFHSL